MMALFMYATRYPTVPLWRKLCICQRQTRRVDGEMIDQTRYFTDTLTGVNEGEQVEISQ